MEKQGTWKVVRLHLMKSYVFSPPSSLGLVFAGGKQKSWRLGIKSQWGELL